MSYFPDTSTGLSASQLNNIGSPAGSDIVVVSRPGAGDYEATTSQIATLIRQTPAGSRIAPLPATLTASDHDKNVVLTGTTGNLSVDGTISDGFRAFLFNNASGAASYLGITGGYGTTSLPSGAVTMIAMAGGMVIAAPPPTAVTTAATAYTSAISSTTGGLNTPVTVSVTPTSGVWPTGTIITFAATGGSGSFSSTTAAAPANSAASLTVIYTPSTANTFTISTTNNLSLTNPGSLTYTASASTASTLSMALGATVGLIGSAVTLTFSPAGGSWPSSTTLTPASTIAGTFSPTTLSPTGSSAATCTFTPSAAGAATISVSNNKSLANPPSLTYTANAAATAYTQALSGNGTGSVGNSVTLTVTPTSGGWPASTTVTPSVSPSNNGSMSPASATPQAGSTAPVVFSFTPSSGGGYSIDSSTSPVMTNTTGALTYTVQASTATAYSVTLSATSGASGAPVTLTFAPVPSNSVWPIGETITPSSSPSTGGFNFSTFTPSAGSTAPLTGTFTPTAPGPYTLGASISPSMTNSTGSLTYTANSSAPAYPTISTGGVTVLSIIDANVGVTTSSGLITSVADQSSSGNNLTATAGVSVGSQVNGFPGFAFNSASYSGCSGLRTSAPWLANLAGPHTIALAFKTGATVPQNATLINMEPASLNYSNDLLLFFNNGALNWWIRPGWQGCIILPAASVTPNTVYKLILRTSSYSFDYWLNGGSKVAGTGNQAASTLGTANFALGQAASSAASSTYSLSSFTGGEILEMHAIQGALSDGDVASYQSYLTSKWGS